MFYRIESILFEPTTPLPISTPATLSALQQVATSTTHWHFFDGCGAVASRKLVGRSSYLFACPYVLPRLGYTSSAIDPTIPFGHLFFSTAAYRACPNERPSTHPF